MIDFKIEKIVFDPSEDSTPTSDNITEEITRFILEASNDLLNGKDEHGVLFINSVWPAMAMEGANEHYGEPSHLTLLPLERVGAPEGKSGAKVLVAYFNDTSLLWCSKPLILKYETNDGIKEKLKQEEINFNKIKPYVREFESSFAAPIHLSKIGNFRCLWSPFLSTVFSVDNRSIGIKPQEHDLWKFLTVTAPATTDSEIFEVLSTEIEQLFDAVYNYLRPLHDHFGIIKKENKRLGDLYKRYLRRPNEWIHKWEDVWGKEERIKGGVDINPIHVYEKLSEVVYNVQIGAVHGDLHPKNILLDSFKRPQIIDFGWSEDKAHILVDFALMEANLRFVTLHDSIPEMELNLLINSLSKDQLDSVNLSSSQYLNFIRKSIISVREKAQTHFKGINFEQEYAISLFMISFGLLKVFDDFKNQTAAQRTVEMMAQHIYDSLLK